MTQMTYRWGASGVCIFIRNDKHKDVTNLIFIPTITENYLTIRNKKSLLDHYEVINTVRFDQIYHQAVSDLLDMTTPRL